MDCKVIPFQSSILVKAHAELGRAVEKCYRPEPFHSDRERVEFLFALYEKLTTPLTSTPAKKPSKKPLKTPLSA
ncbi:MAG TPA: type IIL restriction-modification enzyme MmeI [Verrucomicrobiae bacterium]